MNFFDINMNDFNILLEKELEKRMSSDKNENNTYKDIASNYLLLVELLGVENFKQVKFTDYVDCFLIEVDGKVYDLSKSFSHNNLEATEAICAIECLIADLQEKNIENVLKKTEIIINNTKHNI